MNNTDDVRIEACTRFLDDDSFVKSKAFMEFAYRAKKDDFFNNIALKISLHLELPNMTIQA